MKLIDLNNNPYHNLKIISSKQVTIKGKTYTEIKYGKRDPLCVRIASTAFLKILGVLFRSDRFCVKLSEAKKGRLLDPDMRKRHHTVYSKKSLEEHLWERVQQSESANALFQRALKAQGKEISIQLRPKGLLTLNTGTTWAAAFDQLQSSIFLTLNKKEDSLLSYLIFELGNTAQKQELETVNQELSNGLITSANNYAKKIGSIEYQTAKIHNHVIQESIEKHGWSRSMIFFDNLASDCETHWKENQSSEYSKHYQIHFYTHQKIIKPKRDSLLEIQRLKSPTLDEQLQKQWSERLSKKGLKRLIEEMRQSLTRAEGEKEKELIENLNAFFKDPQVNEILSKEDPFTLYGAYLKLEEMRKLTSFSIEAARHQCESAWQNALLKNPERLTPFLTNILESNGLRRNSGKLFPLIRALMELPQWKSLEKEFLTTDAGRLFLGQLRDAFVKIFTRSPDLGKEYPTLLSKYIVSNKRRNLFNLSC
jgi:hypothetical protein